MKKFQTFVALGIVSLMAAGCGSQSSVTMLPEQTDTAVQSKKSEAPVTKNPVALKDAKFSDSDFSKFAATKDKNSYKPDKELTSTPVKNGPWDTNYLPYRTYNDLESDIRFQNRTDYGFLGVRNANFHFNKSYSAYEYAQNIYKSNSYEMKRFIKLDVLANSLAVEGYEIPYNETHNPPFRPGFKYLPPKASDLMPSFGEIYDYNRYHSGISYITWDLRKASSFYQANYARYMGMIMEFGPTDKYKVWDLVHREISQFAGYYPYPA